jgi:hypothetical protein
LIYKNKSRFSIFIWQHLYYSSDVSIPVAFEVVRKPSQFCDIKTRKEKRASLVTKNELLREMIDTCIVVALSLPTFCWTVGLRQRETLSIL